MQTKLRHFYRSQWFMLTLSSKRALTKRAGQHHEPVDRQRAEMFYDSFHLSRNAPGQTSSTGTPPDSVGRNDGHDPGGRWRLDLFSKLASFLSIGTKTFVPRSGGPNGVLMVQPCFSTFDFRQPLSLVTIHENIGIGPRQGRCPHIDQSRRAESRLPRVD